MDQKFQTLSIESIRDMSDKVNIRESQGEIPESSNTWKWHEVKCSTYKQGNLEPTQQFPEKIRHSDHKHAKEHPESRICTF